MNAYLGYDTVYDRINDEKVYEILVKTDQEIPHIFPVNLFQNPIESHGNILYLVKLKRSSLSTDARDISCNSL